jgi:hypothetical protein
VNQLPRWGVAVSLERKKALISKENDVQRVLEKMLLKGVLV